MTLPPHPRDAEEEETEECGWEGLFLPELGLRRNFADFEVSKFDEIAVVLEENG
jgi:hypothetical protein